MVMTSSGTTAALLNCTSLGNNVRYRRRAINIIICTTILAATDDGDELKRIKGKPLVSLISCISANHNKSSDYTFRSGGIIRGDLEIATRIAIHKIEMYNRKL